MLDRYVPVSPLMQPRRAAGEENNDSTQQGADGRSQDRPSCSTVVSVGVGGIIIDIGSDDAEQDEVDDHDDHGGEEGHERNNGRQEGTDNPGTGSEEEGDEVQTAGDGVKDHNAGQNLGGGAGGVRELCLLNASHYIGRAVANVGFGAGSARGMSVYVCLVGRGVWWRRERDIPIADIVQAVAKGTKRDRGVRCVAVIDLQDGEMAHHWRGDTRND